MKRVLVIGDTIVDEYVFGHATRLCPEGPVPVIVPARTETRGGGARLVANQLEVLIGAENVLFLSGSQSVKKRIFADDRLICRLDEDSKHTEDPDLFSKKVICHLPDFDLLVISDYGKGALNLEAVNRIMLAASVPVLVDAKNNFDWYPFATALFPNEYEKVSLGAPDVIRKLGARGCSVNGQMIPLESEHAVRDVTGAGDCFLAAFAAKTAAGETGLVRCARFANRVAARSVEFVGTQVVTDVKL